MRYKIAYAVLLVYAAGVYLYAHDAPNFGIDWRDSFHPATMMFLRGENPYDLGVFHNPVWALIPMIPFALLGERLGEIALFIAGMFAFAYAARRMGASPFAMTVFGMSFFVFYSLFLGNIDWLVALGFFLPPVYGLFFVLLKPQIGIGMVLYWLWDEWQEGGLQRVMVTFSPVTAGIAMNFAVYGNWISGNGRLAGEWWNVSIFPYGIPVGLVLLWLALQRRNGNRAAAASPFFAPYLSGGSWSIAGIGLADNDRLTFALTVLVWGLYFGEKVLR